MPTDDVQIRAVGTAPVPFGYIIPGNGQLQPKAINATFDGTGAAGTFLPTLEIVSDGGVIVSRCPLGSPIAAGASAEVSWFPHVGGSGGGAAGALMCARVNQVGNVSIPHGDPGVRVPWGEAVIDTGSPAPFWSAGTPTRITCPVNGIYLLISNVNYGDQAVPANTIFGNYIYLNGAAFPGFTFEWADGAVISFVPSSNTYLSGHHNIWQASAGDYFELLCFQENGSNADLSLLDERPAFNHYSSFGIILIAAT